MAIIFWHFCTAFCCFPSNSVKKKTHLVKDAALTDKLLSGLGVDSNGEAHMRDEQLGGKSSISEAVNQ